MYVTRAGWIMNGIRNVNCTFDPKLLIFKDLRIKSQKLDAKKEILWKFVMPTTQQFLQVS
jgi:hypothetical protein